MTSETLAVLAPVIVIVRLDSMLSATGRARYGAYVSHIVPKGEDCTACGRFSGRDVLLAPVGYTEVECRACQKALAARGIVP